MEGSGRKNFAAPGGKNCYQNRRSAEIRTSTGGGRSKDLCSKNCTGKRDSFTLISVEGIKKKRGLTFLVRGRGRKKGRIAFRSGGEVVVLPEKGKSERGKHATSTSKGSVDFESLAETGGTRSKNCGGEEIRNQKEEKFPFLLGGGRVFGEGIPQLKKGGGDRGGGFFLQQKPISSEKGENFPIARRKHPEEENLLGERSLNDWKEGSSRRGNRERLPPLPGRPSS